MPKFENAFALSIGVGADMPITVADATAIADFLRDDARCAYKNENVRLLTEEKAKRIEILDGLKWLADVASENDTVIIFFSGHGGFQPEFHLVPFGYDKYDIHDTAIRATELTTALKKISASRMLVLFDCCYAAGQAKSAEEERGLPTGQITSAIVEELSKGKGRVVLASSAETELSWTSKPYSEFTKAAIEAFAGYGSPNGDGYARVFDIAKYAFDVVPKRTEGKQNPVFKTDDLQNNFAIGWYSGGKTAKTAVEWAKLPNEYVEPRKELQRLQKDLENYSREIETERIILEENKESLRIVRKKVSQFGPTDVPTKVIKEQIAAEKLIDASKCRLDDLEAMHELDTVRLEQLKKKITLTGNEVGTAPANEIKPMPTNEIYSDNDSAKIESNSTPLSGGKLDKKQFYHPTTAPDPRFPASWKSLACCSFLALLVAGYGSWYWCPIPARNRLIGLGFQIDLVIRSSKVDVTVPANLPEKSIRSGAAYIDNAWTRNLFVTNKGKLSENAMDSLVSIANIERLDLVGTGIDVRHLNEWCKRLNNLQHLRVENCEYIHSYTLVGQSSLKEIHLWDCKLLTLKLSGLDNLTTLDIHSAKFSSTVSKKYSIYDMPRLNSIEIKEVEFVKEIYISGAGGGSNSPTAFATIKILNNPNLTDVILQDVETAGTAKILAIDLNPMLENIYLYEMDEVDFAEISFYPVAGQEKQTTVWVETDAIVSKLSRILERQGTDIPVIKKLDGEQRSIIAKIIESHRQN